MLYNCKNCQAELNLDETINFCPSCGTKIEVDPPLTIQQCPKCQAELMAGAKFCAVCGEKIPDVSSMNSATVTDNLSIVPVEVCGEETAKEQHTDNINVVADESGNNINSAGKLKLANPLVRGIITFIGAVVTMLLGAKGDDSDLNGLYIILIPFALSYVGFVLFWLYQWFNDINRIAQKKCIKIWECVICLLGIIVVFGVVNSITPWEMGGAVWVFLGFLVFKLTKAYKTDALIGLSFVIYAMIFICVILSSIGNSVTRFEYCFIFKIITASIGASIISTMQIMFNYAICDFYKEDKKILRKSIDATTWLFYGMMTIECIAISVLFVMVCKTFPLDRQLWEIIPIMICGIIVAPQFCLIKGKLLKDKCFGI